MKKGILVLESPWSQVITDATSVRPFFEGWSLARDKQFPFSYRMFFDSKGLENILIKFVRSKELQVCYIAGHGEGGRLCGAHGQDINPVNIAKATKGMRIIGHKGILFGACDVGRKLKDFLYSCGGAISWVAGYEITVPWFESTICDLLFLQYILEGRVIKESGEFKTRKRNFVTLRAKNASQARKWIIQDYPLAKSCGLVAYDK